MRPDVIRSEDAVAEAVATPLDAASVGLVPPRRRVPIPWDGPQTAERVFAGAVASQPEADAIIGRYTRLRYADLDEAVERACGALARLGIRPGDRIAASMGNHPALVVAFFATLRMGAIWAGVNPQLAPEEKSYLLRDIGASVFLGDTRSINDIGRHLKELPDLRRVIDCEPSDPGCEWTTILAEGGDGAPIAEIDPWAPAAISFTSGTSGRPKGAVHSHHNMMVIVWRLTALSPDRTVTRYGVCLPITLLNLMILGPLANLAAGTTCVLVDRVDATGVYEWVRREDIETMVLAPTQLHDLLTHPELDLEPLRGAFRPRVGGADCPVAWRELSRERGFPVVQGYGLTEAPTAVTVGGPSDPPGSSGRAHALVRVVILDPDCDRPLAPNEVGRVCVGPVEDGPYAHVYTPMLGYWNRPEETGRALRGGLLHTGDIGRLDEQGFLYLHDREDDLIIRGGANVYPAEVERVLAVHESVAASAVVGLPDDRLGERVVAAVEVMPGATVTAEELRSHCIEYLARYKVPDEVVVTTALPRTAMGKVLRRDVRRLWGSA